MTSQFDAPDVPAEAFSTVFEAELESRSTDFMPWHRPRKQWVREDQWVHFARILLGEIAEDQKKLKYVSLPGPDLLDIRVLADLCGQHNIGLRYLGLEKYQANHQRATISQAEVGKHPAVESENSTIIADNLEALAIKHSVAARGYRNFGPADIVNIDLCESIATKDRPNSPNYFDALATIFTMQKKKPSWLLYLTTNISKDAVFDDHLQKMGSIVWDNREGSDNFANFFHDQYSDVGSRDDLIAQMLRDENAHAPKIDYYKLFSLSLMKWILQTAMSGQPRHTVKVLSCCVYSTVGENQDIVSLVIRFDQITEPANDNAGLAAQAYQANDFEVAGEAELAVQAARKLLRGLDLDHRLAQDPQEYSRKLASSKALLHKARYDTDAYEKWVEEKEATVQEGNESNQQLAQPAEEAPPH